MGRLSLTWLFFWSKYLATAAFLGFSSFLPAPPSPFPLALGLTTGLEKSWSNSSTSICVSSSSAHSTGGGCFGCPAASAAAAAAAASSAAAAAAAAASPSAKAASLMGTRMLKKSRFLHRIKITCS